MTNDQAPIGPADLFLRFFVASTRGAGVEISDLEEAGHSGIA
jgi:hypothetical protein